MWKTLFKPENTSSNTEVLTKSYPKEVLEIHHEFDTAADKLLEQAKACIAEAESKDTTKVSRLESLGFKQAAQVVEIKPLLDQAELSKEQVTLVNYYKQSYPFNKFITEEQVKTICHKYNLDCNDVTRFKGFVPEKNLKEIEKFQLKEKDKLRFLKYGAIKYTQEEWDQRFTSENRKVGGISRGGILDYTYAHETTETYNTTLKICAPIKDMDISNLELIDGYKLEKHIPDPVVLQQVKGGYLILTAWGDEASDPLVVNQINN